MTRDCIAIRVDGYGVCVTVHDGPVPDEVKLRDGLGWGVVITSRAALPRLAKALARVAEQGIPEDLI